MAARLRAPVPKGALRLARSPVPGAFLGFLLVAGCGHGGDSMVLREVVAEPLARDDAFEVARERADAPVEVGVLCPSTSWRVDGSDAPALLMPPPAEASFVVPSGLGPVVLRASAGIDHGSAGTRGFESVAFRVRVDGETVFDEAVPLPADEDGRRNAWRHVGGSGGIVVAPGARVTLETAATPAAGEGSTPVRAGFGRLWLESHTGRARERATPDRPNIVVVVMDTQRRDRVSAHGHTRVTTPNVDALAERGTRFSEARATSSWTWPSTASILTGLLPQRHGVLDHDSCFLANALSTLPEALQRAGYTTAAFSGNPLIAPSRNFDQGFEHFRASPRFEKSGTFLPEALDWIAEHRDTRFFLYLQLVEPHMEYLPSEESRHAMMGPEPDDLPEDPIEHYAARLLAGEGRTPEGGFDAGRVVPFAHRRYIDELYDASVHTGDAWFGRVVGAIENLGLADSTVLVYTSDHGEELFDHELFEHGHTIHVELVGVPLVIAGPGVPEGRSVTTPVSNRHLAPTLARLAGAELDPVLGPDDALDLLGAIGTEPVFFSTRHGWWDGWKDQPVHGVLADGWTLHHAPTAGRWGADTPTEGGHVRLYASDDPKELRDVAELHPDVVRRLRALIEERWKREASARVALPIPAGAATETMLRDVGYLGDDE